METLDLWVFLAYKLQKQAQPLEAPKGAPSVPK